MNSANLNEFCKFVHTIKSCGLERPDTQVRLVAAVAVRLV